MQPKTEALSSAAKAALINASRKPGAIIPADFETMGELKRAGFAGPARGLTYQGEIARSELFAARLDAAF